MNTSATVDRLFPSLADRYGEVALSALRSAMAASGLADRAGQDKAVSDAQWSGRYYLVMVEGRYGVSSEDRAAAITDPQLGHLYTRLARRQG